MEERIPLDILCSMARQGAGTVTPKSAAGKSPPSCVQPSLFSALLDWRGSPERGHPWQVCQLRYQALYLHVSLHLCSVTGPPQARDQEAPCGNPPALFLLPATPTGLHRWDSGRTRLWHQESPVPWSCATGVGWLAGPRQVCVRPSLPPGHTKGSGPELGAIPSPAQVETVRQTCLLHPPLPFKAPGGTGSTAVWEGMVLTQSRDGMQKGAGVYPEGDSFILERDAISPERCQCTPQKPLGFPAATAVWRHRALQEGSETCSARAVPVPSCHAPKALRGLCLLRCPEGDSGESRGTNSWAGTMKRF